MTNHEWGPIRNSPEVFFDKETGAVMGVSVRPSYLDRETVAAIAENLVKFPREVVFEYKLENDDNNKKPQYRIIYFNTSTFKSIQNCNPEERGNSTAGIIRLMSKSRKVNIYNPKFAEAQNAEQNSFFILENAKRNAIIGINHTNPGAFKKNYWAELLQKQIDCDGERQLTLIIAHPGKPVEVKTFEDLGKQVRGLSEKERDNFLSGILEQIPQTKKIILMENDEKKDIPINENLSRSKIPSLSNIQLQNLVGDISSLDKI